VTPRDGLRQRLDVVIPDRRLPFAEDLSRLKIALARDGFAAGEAATIDKSLATIRLRLENRTGDTHETALRLSLPVGTSYTLALDGARVALTHTADPDYPWTASLPMHAASATLVLERAR
jgi:hypothetical protein